MKLYTLLIITFTLLTSCSSQNTSGAIKLNPATEPGNIVSAMSKNTWIVFQATNGDYWFGGDTDGVFRFDGKAIIHFSTNDGLSSNRIRGIQEDKQGNIYFSTLGGINKFDGHSFSTLTAIKSTAPNDNWKLQPDDLWFSILGKNGDKGPYRYDGKNLYQLEFPKHYLADDYFKNFPDNPWSPYDVYYIYKDSKGTMWFGTSNFGICRYDGKTLSWLYEDHLTNVPGGGSFGIRSILEDKKGKFWFCNTRYRYNISPDSITANGKSLIRYEKEQGIEDIKTANGTDHIYFLSAIEDNSGDLWMATYNEGVWRYHEKEIIHYAVKDGEREVTLFSIYKDRKGALWLGSPEAGAYKFNGYTFEKFRP